MKKYYEIQANIYLMQNISKEDIYDKLSNFINYSFNNSQILSCLHKDTGFKHFSYGGLYPIEKDGIYKADETYILTLRTYKTDIKNELIKCLDNLKNDDFVAIDVNSKDITHRDINYIDSLTPTIVTLKGGKRWQKEINTSEELETALFKNLLRKYNHLNNLSLEIKQEDVIKGIDIKSKCAIIINYKGIKFLGYKFRIYFKENMIAQELAQICEVEGMGEKNSSFGAGFVKAYYRR